MFQVLTFVTLFALTLTEGMRTRVHMQLQADPDATCKTWLDSQEGQTFVNCTAGNPGVPVPNPDNNCLLTTEEMDLYCGDPCFESVINAYDFILATGTCLPVYEDLYKPCAKDADCVDVTGAGIPKMCFQGFCYNSCNSSNDCNYCTGETCDSLGNAQGCRSNITRAIQGDAALVNRTIHNTYRGMIYSIKAACSQNAAGDYCSMMSLVNATCDSLAAWGCCPITIFGSMQSCEWKNYTTASGFAPFLNCNFSTQACQDMPPAKQYCQVVNATSINNSSSSGLSSSSSSTGSGPWTGSTGHTGQTGVGGTGNGAAGKSISWTVSIALVLAVARIVS